LKNIFEENGIRAETIEHSDTLIEKIKKYVDGRGDYVLALKGNQLLLYEEVQAFFEETELVRIRKSGNGYKKTVEKEHGALRTGNIISRKMLGGMRTGKSGKG